MNKDCRLISELPELIIYNAINNYCNNIETLELCSVNSCKTYHVNNRYFAKVYLDSIINKRTIINVIEFTRRCNTQINNQYKYIRTQEGAFIESIIYKGFKFNIIMTEGVTGKKIDKHNFRKIDFLNLLGEKVAQLHKLSDYSGTSRIGIIHGDLRNHNMFLSNNGIELIDFDNICLSNYINDFYSILFCIWDDFSFYTSWENRVKDIELFFEVFANMYNSFKELPNNWKDTFLKGIPEEINMLIDYYQNTYLIKDDCYMENIMKNLQMTKADCSKWLSAR